MQRKKQIDYGKNTPGYRNYTKCIPKYAKISLTYCNFSHYTTHFLFTSYTPFPDRKNRIPKVHMHTPNIHWRCSKRTFDQSVRQWRLYLHQWDSVETADNSGLPMHPQTVFPFTFAPLTPCDVANISPQPQNHHTPVRMNNIPVQAGTYDNYLNTVPSNHLYSNNMYFYPPNNFTPQSPAAIPTPFPNYITPQNNLMHHVPYPPPMPSFEEPIPISDTPESPMMNSLEEHHRFLSHSPYYHQSTPYPSANVSPQTALSTPYNHLHNSSTRGPNITPQSSSPIQTSSQNRLIPNQITPNMSNGNIQRNQNTTSLKSSRSPNTLSKVPAPFYSSQNPSNSTQMDHSKVSSLSSPVRSVPLSNALMTPQPFHYHVQQKNLPSLSDNYSNSHSSEDNSKEDNALINTEQDAQSLSSLFKSSNFQYDEEQTFTHSRRHSLSQDTSSESIDSFHSLDDLPGIPHRLLTDSHSQNTLTDSSYLNPQSSLIASTPPTNHPILTALESLHASTPTKQDTPFEPERSSGSLHSSYLPDLLSSSNYSDTYSHYSSAPTHSPNTSFIIPSSANLSPSSLHGIFSELPADSHSHPRLSFSPYLSAEQANSSVLSHSPLPSDTELENRDATHTPLPFQYPTSNSSITHAESDSSADLNSKARSYNSHDELQYSSALSSQSLRHNTNDYYVHPAWDNNSLTFH